MESGNWFENCRWQLEFFNSVKFTSSKLNTLTSLIDLLLLFRIIWSIMTVSRQRWISHFAIFNYTKRSLLLGYWSNTINHSGLTPYLKPQLVQVARGFFLAPLSADGRYGRQRQGALCFEILKAIDYYRYHKEPISIRLNSQFISCLPCRFILHPKF